MILTTAKATEKPLSAAFTVAKTEIYEKGELISMSTKETIEKLPSHVSAKIELLREKYKNENSIYSKATVRSGIYEYGCGLRDAGLITERERQIIFVYATV